MSYDPLRAGIVFERRTLAQRLGTEWPHIDEARQRTVALRAKLDALTSLATEDASTIMYGSIGREEVTESSDVDWTILIDGPSDPSHFQLVTKMTDHLNALGFTARPNRHVRSARQ